ncbi:MAG: hypothetical protein H7Y38_01085 [Armatimonadetes bacterium]|nr:hypothetical protein [Armatimonadota bacterium]
MPKLTIDLPESAYRAALNFDSREQVRLVTATFIVAEAALEDIPDYHRETNEADLKVIGRSLQDEAEGRIIQGEVAMARFREQFSEMVRI